LRLVPKVQLHGWPAEVSPPPPALPALERAEALAALCSPPRVQSQRPNLLPVSVVRQGLESTEQAPEQELGAAQLLQTAA